MKRVLLLAISLCVSLTFNAQTEYCTVSGGGDSYISSVTTTGGETNISYRGSAPSYDNYELTDAKLTVVKGVGFTLSVTKSDSSRTFVSIDWNGNKIFNDRSAHSFGIALASSSINFTYAISVPIDAITGNVRMRIVTEDDGRISAYRNSNNNVTCGFHARSSIKDFIIKIIDPPPTPPPSPTISSTVPASVEVGSNLSVALMYTSIVDAIVSIELAKYDSNGDYIDNSQVAYKEKNVTAGNGSVENLTIAIPTSTNPSSSLTGDIYLVSVRLLDRSYNTLAKRYKGINITGTATTVAPTITSTVPASVNIGDSLSVALTYTSTVDAIVSIELAKYSGGTYVGDSQVAYKEKNVTAGNGSVENLTIAIPANTNPTSSLTVGESYKLRVRLLNRSYNTLAIHDKDIIVNNIAQAKSKQNTIISEFNQNKENELSDIYISPNPTKDIIYINNISKNTGYILLNIRGQVLKKGILTADKKNRLDISSLAKGIYLLKIKTDKKSFIKKVVRN